MRVQQNYVTKTIRNFWLAQEFSLWPTKSSTTEIEIETREQRKKERGIAYFNLRMLHGACFEKRRTCCDRQTDSSRR